MSGQTEPPGAPEPPELLKAALWVWHHARANWYALVKAPVLAALMIVAVLGFLGGRVNRAEQHDIDQQHISFLQDQIGAYKDRLQGATPDEAAKRFSTLEKALSIANAKIGRFMPDTKRRLTESDKAFILSNRVEIKNIIPSRLEIFSMSFGDSFRYALDFSEQFKLAGILASDPTPSSCQDDEAGVLVGIKDPMKPSENAARFISFLTEMGMHPTPTRWYAAPDELSFDLFICAEAITISLPAASPPSPAPRAAPEGKLQ